MPLSEVNTAYRDSAPFLSFDGLTLYFVRANTDTFSYARIFQATRSVPSGPFTSVEEISTLNYSGGDLGAPWVSPDNLRMYYYRKESGNLRLKISERASVSIAWPTGINISELNALGHVTESSMTSDELIIVFQGINVPGGQGFGDIWMANRPNRSSPFENIGNLVELNTVFEEGYPLISSDGLTLLFHSNRNGLYQLFKATRTSLTEPFSNLEHLSFFDTPGGDSGAPCPSYDGTAIYFVSWLSDGNRDIYVSYLTEPRTLIGLEIVGPNEVAENFSAGYKAIAYYDDDSTRDVTKLAGWAVEPEAIESIEEGVLTTKDIVSDQPASILAGYTEGDITVAAEKTIDIFAICPTGTALSFDGVDDYVDCGSDQSLDVTELTWSLWIKRAETTYTNERALISNEGGGVNTRGTYALQIDVGSQRQDKIQFVRHGDSTWPLSKIAIRDTDWHYIAVTRNSSGDVVIYIDGKPDSTGTIGTSTAYTKTVIGAGHTAYSNFKGLIDEVSLYNRDLSGEEIWGNMHNRLAGDEAGLVGYWDFDEGEGQIVYDLSGNGNDGQLGSTPEVDAGDPAWIESDAPIGRCTPYLIAVAAAEKALKHKSASLKELQAALAQEWIMYEALEQLLESGDFVDLSKGDIVTSKQKAHSAMQHEEQSIDMLGKGFEKLLDSLISLGYEPESLMP
jgi:hypothetical protein